MHLILFQNFYFKDCWISEHWLKPKHLFPMSHLSVFSPFSSVTLSYKPNITTRNYTNNLMSHVLAKDS